MLFGKDLYAQVPLTEVSPPALPSLSPQVWQAAFVHSSKNITQIPRSKFRYAEDFADNERLEWVGDALLYSIVANYLFRTYPKLRVSYLSAIRQRMVQNATLAKFAKLYKMDQALMMGAGSENMRYDQKTLADTFEAFVGAVHQVHGLELTTKWVEDLIRPYASQLYEHYARIYGEDPTADVDSSSPSVAPSGTPSNKRRWRRFCGFIPLPFLWSAAESKPIAGSSSGQEYGTLVTVSQLATNQGYTRLPDQSGPSGSQKANGNAQQSALKKTKSQDASSSPNAIPAAPSTAVKRSKSRDRVAFTPPSVSNVESLKANQKKSKQSGSLSEGEAPRTVPGLPKPPSTPKHAKAQARTNGNISESEAPVKAAQQQGSKQPETVIYPVTSSDNVNRPPAATIPSSTFGWSTPAKDSSTASGAPVWDSSIAATAPKPENGKASLASATPQKAILQRPQGTPNGQAPQVGVSKSLSQAQVPTTSIADYAEALTAARSDPVSYLESHPLFNSSKNRKGKTLEYDESLSTPKKCTVQIKVDGRVVASSAAAGADTKLAKARAAFKAIDALSLLPDAPSDVVDGGFSKPAQPLPKEEPEVEQKRTVPDSPKKSVSAVKPVQLAVPGNSVWPVDMFKKPAPERVGLSAPETPAPASVANAESTSNVTSAPASNAVQMKKQTDCIANPPGPLPGTIYASLPAAGVKGSGARYYITSVKGFNGGTYHAIINENLELIGQSASSKKAVAIEEAERMARENTTSGKTLNRVAWEFVDCSKTGTLSKKAKLQENAKANTGALPLLTHALAVDPSEPSRIIWLEWYADDKKAWKCVVFADAIFFGSGKSADRRVAITTASEKALEELEKAQTS